MEKLSSVSFFCPAYHDAENLPDLIPVVDEFLSKWAHEYEILIIEDGSPDSTGRVADELARAYPKVRVVHHEKNCGYTATLVEGFKSGKYDYVMYTDGDNQYDVKEFEPYIPLLKEADGIAGYATVKAVSTFRKFQSAVHNVLISILFGTRFKDVNCSMKIFKRTVLETISFTSSPLGAFVDAELMIRAQKQGYVVKQFPVTHYARKGGVGSGSKPNLVFHTIKDMIRLRFTL